jgi:hypothetical protein
MKLVDITFSQSQPHQHKQPLSPKKLSMYSHLGVQPKYVGLDIQKQGDLLRWLGL